MNRKKQTARKYTGGRAARRSKRSQAQQSSHATVDPISDLPPAPSWDQGELSPLVDSEPLPDHDDPVIGDQHNFVSQAVFVLKIIYTN
jgi:hypothetical protein